jgi:hypothetical protein
MAPNPGDLYIANMFNDAARFFEGGLWQNAVEENNREFGNDVRYTSDRTTDGLNTNLAAGEFSSDQHTHINTVIADIATALNNAQGAAQKYAEVEAARRAIINTIQGDPVLEALSVTDGNPSSNFAPPASSMIASEMPVNFSEIGMVFDGAQSMARGAINANKVNAIKQDLQVSRHGTQNIMQNRPELLAGTTRIHAQRILKCLDFELTKVVPGYGV